MKNYVIMYHLSDKKASKLFQKELENRFPRNNTVIENGFQYFSFADYELAGVSDSLIVILNGMTPSDEDYVALFYIREEEPDLINRLMIYGPADLIEKDLENISKTLQRNILTELIEMDFVNK